MYRTFDEKIGFAPEAMVSGVPDAAAGGEPRGLADDGPGRQSAHGADATPAAAGDGGAAGTDEQIADPIDAWSRHARAANGFGG